jgi:hypothetical protein
MSRYKVFTISNIAGGDKRSFRLDRDGDLSGRAIHHAKNIGFGGPAFGGPAADQASEKWDEWYQDWLDNDR